MFNFYRSWRKLAISLILVALVFMLNACATNTQTKGKELSVKVDDKIMLTKDYQAKITVTTNTDNTTFKLTANKKTIRSGKFNSKKKAELVVNEPGKYTLTIKSPHEAITKKITVEPYTVIVNKSTTSVDNTQYIIKKIVYEKVKKTKTPDDNAENNLSDYDQLNAQYYRAKIYYELQNNGDAAIDLSYTQASIIDDSGKDYSFEGTADAYSYDSIDSILRPKTRRTGYFVMISNTPFSLENLKININSYSDTNGDLVGNGGIFELNQENTSSSTAITPSTETSATQDTNYADPDDTTIEPESSIDDSTDDSDDSDDTNDTTESDTADLDMTEDQDEE